MTFSAEAEVNLQNLFLLQNAIKASIDEGLESAGKLIVDLASQLAPEETGELKKSGDSYVSEHVLYVSFGNGLPDSRAIAQEYGTMYMPAQPYLSVAVKEIDVVEEMAIAIRRRIT